MSNEEPLSIVGRHRVGRLDFNDGVFASRDDEAVRVVLIRWEEGQAVNVFGATADKSAFKVRGACRCSLPYSDGAVSRGREGKVGRREADGAHLQRRSGVSRCNFLVYNECDRGLDIAVHQPRGQEAALKA